MQRSDESVGGLRVDGGSDSGTPSQRDQDSSSDTSTVGAPPAPPQWHPIASAPKDDVVLVHDEGYVGKGLLQEDGRWLDVECGRADAFFDPAPTEWMPLPQPPLPAPPAPQEPHK